MKKIFFVLTLLFSITINSSFDITTFECQLSNAPSPSKVPDIIYLRLDEKRQKIRINLMPEKKYVISDGFDGALKSNIDFYNHNHSITFYTFTWYLEYARKSIKNLENNLLVTAGYKCKII